MTSSDDFVGVVGAAGQFGGLAAGALMRKLAPERIVLISRTPEKLERFAKQGAKVWFGDFDLPDDLPRAFEGVASLLLISSNAIGRRVAQHSAAIEAARKAGVRRVAYTSFLGAEPGNPALVARDHCATERALRQSGLEWTILRNAQYSEAILDVIMPNALASGEWRSASGDGRIAPVSRADCAECAAIAVLRPDAAGAIYEITGPDLLRYRDVAEQMALAFAKPVRFTPVDNAGLYAMFDALGAPRAPSGVMPGGFPWCSDDMVSFESALRDGWFDVESQDAHGLLGRPPRAFADLLKERLQTMRETIAR